MSKRILSLRPTFYSISFRLNYQIIPQPLALRKCLIPASSSCHNVRHYSSEGEPKTTVSASPSSTGYIWPSPFKMIKNFVMLNFLIPRFDPDFNLPDFMTGAKKAVEVISKLMSQGDYLEMEKFVEPVVVASIKDSLKNSTAQELEDLAVATPDIMVSFPYSVQTFSTVDDNDKARRIDILIVCHVLKDWGSQKDNPEVVIQLQNNSELQKKVQFLNYQFSRLYNTTEESDWTVTGVHHFKPQLDS